MLRRKKYLVLSLILFLAAVFLGITIYLRNSRHSDPAVERIKNHVNRISKADLQNSLSMLGLMEFYNWPGSAIGTDEISFFTEESRYKENVFVLDKILSNRVFRKCYYELSRISNDKAADFVNKEIRQTLSDYQKNYESILEDCRKNNTSSIVFQVSDNREGKTTFWGLRYKIFALILIAESLRLTGCHETIIEVAGQAIKQKNEIQKFNNQFLEFTLLVDASLFNSYVLAAGLYGTCHNKNTSELASFAPRYIKKELVGYSAPLTEYDTTLIRIDIEKSKTDKDNHIDIYFLEKATDADVQTLMKF
jgi:hypothetical protein